MDKIKVMSESLANKIAAGEVVEKCSSIVKELCENSIDANAKNIIINLEEGGKKLIEVIDDGDGMSRADASLAFMRHATSKLTREDDLFFIGTLGFRGEALPSIASVSRVELKTSDNKTGTHIIIYGGKKELEEGSDVRKGTSIKITNLFYNTPARLKYLKSEQAELSNCVSFVERLALSHPEISFALNHDNHPVVKTTGSNDLLKAIHEVYGLNISSKMLEIKNSNDDFDIYGFICKPEILKSNRNHIITIVNDRIVKNYDLLKCINDAYYNYKPDTKYPIVVLKINTDPILVDVNIHPTKQDIKISKINDLLDLITKTIKDKLYEALLVQDGVLRMAPTNTVKQEIVESVIQEESVPYGPREQTKMDFTYESDNRKDETSEKREIEILKLYPIGQIHNTFIIAQNESGAYLIDQHAAAERINYEKIKEAYQNKELLLTDLLIPITIELSSSDFLIIKENIDYLSTLGIIVEEFGLNSIIIKSHPTWFTTGHEEETIRSIIDLIIEEKKSIKRETFEEHLIQTMACKMSIKAHDPLSLTAMEELLDELFKCDNPYNCAHGRPSIIKFSNYELDRMFKRAMN